MIRKQLGVLVVMTLSAAPLAAADESVKLEAGKPAPDFTLKDQDGKEVKLSGLKGKKSVLLAFYPKDFTGG